MEWPASRGGHSDDTRRTGNNLNCLKYGYFIKNQDISADRKYVGNIKSLMERFDKYVEAFVFCLHLSRYSHDSGWRFKSIVWFRDAPSHKNIIIMSHVLFNVSFVSLLLSRRSHALLLSVKPRVSVLFYLRIYPPHSALAIAAFTHISQLMMAA